MTFSVYEERGLTGDFRIRHGRIECLAIIRIRQRTTETVYRTWRPAIEADFDFAYETSPRRATEKIRWQA